MSIPMVTLNGKIALIHKFLEKYRITNAFPIFITHIKIKNVTEL